MVRPQMLWIDLEMTGLNVLHDRIIEIAAVLTDFDLSHIAGSDYHRIMHCDDKILNSMDDWCTKTHGASGLTESVRKSGNSIAEVESDLLKHLRSFNCEERTLLLAGNSIHADRIFLTLQMPKLTAFLHYRQIDVSTVKTLAQHWNPQVSASAPAKKTGHRATDDILESIEELKHYKRAWLKT